MKQKLSWLFAVAGLFAFIHSYHSQQAQVEIGTKTGVRARLAVADFQLRSSDPQLTSMTQIFNEVLWNDLDMSGVFGLVPKSFYPVKLPSQPQEVVYELWKTNEVKAQDLAYGNTSVDRGQFVAECRLVDVSTQESIAGLRYRVALDEPGVRTAAHRFADEIVLKIGGGIPGVGQTSICFASDRTGNKEIWVMDYDGFGQHAVTNHRSISLTPRWSRGNSKIAYTSYRRGHRELR